jgi:hypothetical protein
MSYEIGVVVDTKCFDFINNAREGNDFFESNLFESFSSLFELDGFYFYHWDFVEQLTDEIREDLECVQGVNLDHCDVFIVDHDVNEVEHWGECDGNSFNVSAVTKLVWEREGRGKRIK